jgi:hypothetical protein
MKNLMYKYPFATMCIGTIIAAIILYAIAGLILYYDINYGII